MSDAPADLFKQPHDVLTTGDALSQLQIDAGKGTPLKFDLPGQSDTLVKSGALPSLGIDDHGSSNKTESGGFAGRSGSFADLFKRTDHDNGGDGGLNPWSQPAYKGDWFHGKEHQTPQEKLWNKAYDGLSDKDKQAYDKESPAAEKYQSQMMTWELGGKKGPAPDRPTIPEHDKVTKQVNDEKQAVEARVKEHMLPDERAKYETAKAQYEKDVAAAPPFRTVAVPDAVADYNKRIAEATGLKTESESDYALGKMPPSLKG